MQRKRLAFAAAIRPTGEIQSKADAFANTHWSLVLTAQGQSPAAELPWKNFAPNRSDEHVIARYCQRVAEELEILRRRVEETADEGTGCPVEQMDSPLHDVACETSLLSNQQVVAEGCQGTPNRPNWTGCGLTIVVIRLPFASKRYTAPPFSAAVLSSAAAMAVLFPTTAIAEPKRSDISGLGFVTVWTSKAIIAVRTLNSTVSLPQTSV